MAVSDSHAGSKIRGMGCHEAYQLAMHTLDQYRGTMVVCRYFPLAILTRPESLATLKTRFYDALAKVVLDQPHLQTGIVDENSKNPSFVRLDRLDLRHHVQWNTVNDASRFQQMYLDIAQTQLDTRYENISTQPGWKVIVLHEDGAESIEVFYVWNHVHHDGSSGKIFHQQLLQRLNETTIQNNGATNELPENSNNWILDLPDQSNTLPPNPELLSSWPISPTVLLTQLWKELKPELIFSPGPLHAHWAPLRATPYKTLYRNFTIPHSTVTNLIIACRAHNTTITSLLQSLCLASFSTILSNEEAKGFASRTPYDLRQILPSKTKEYPWLQPKDLMCNYVSVIEHEFGTKLVEEIRSRIPSSTSTSTSSISTSTSTSTSTSKLTPAAMETIWTVSTRVRREIKTRLDSGTRNDLIGIMKLCPDWNTQQQSEIRRKTRYLSWLVTNLGVFDGDGEKGPGEDEGWSLRRAELILSAETPSAAVSVSVMTVKGREMCVTASWQDCVVEEGVGERLMGDLERWLGEIGG